MKVLEFIHGWSMGSMIVRLLLAMAAGMLVGVDRERKNRGAGMKTHVLVCIGAALAMMTSEYIYHEFPDARADMARIGAQVVSGVGFLGVGTIMVTGKNQIRGLTTAAGLWASACAGIAIGIGFVEGALTGDYSHHVHPACTKQDGPEGEKERFGFRTVCGV